MSSKNATIQKIKLKQQAQHTNATPPTTHVNKISSPSTSTASSSSSSSFSLPTATRSSSRRWGLDLTDSRPASTVTLINLHPHSSQSHSQQGTQIIPVDSNYSNHDLIPYGYGVGADAAKEDDRQQARDESKHADLIYKSAMSMATAPGKQLFMTMFMLWMSGNTLQIFSIMMLSMAMWTPLSEILNIATRFARYADSGVDLTLPKLTFIGLNLCGLAVGLYKCQTMGLLPTSVVDWVDHDVRPALHVAGGGIV